MGRMKRVKGKKAERYKANPFALVPVDKEGLKMRLERHANLMSDLLSQGKDFNSLPVTVLKTIVRDFQIAGLDVPTPALQRIHEHQQAGLKNRPAPIFLPAVTNQSRDKDLRSELISRGFNPKTGFSESGPSIPHHDPGLARAGVKLPYVPVHRYGKSNLFSDAANKTAASWLPPWMVYGDQPNQFVKTPRPMSMGHGPSFQYSNQYYQGGRTFGPHNVIQRAALSGMRPSVAAFPLVPDQPPVAWFNRKQSNPEPMGAVKEPISRKADEPSRLFTNRYPVRGEIPPMSQLQEPPNTPAAVLADSGKVPDMIDFERPVRVPARGKASLVEQSKKVRATEEEAVRDLIDLDKPTRTSAVRRMPASSADEPRPQRKKRQSEPTPMEEQKQTRTAKKRASDLVKAVAADDATSVARTPAAASRRSPAPDAPSKGYVRGLDAEPMRAKANLEEGSRKVSATKEKRARKRAVLEEGSKKVKAIEELAPAAILAELPFADEFEGSPPKKARSRRVPPPRVARGAKKKAAAKRAPWKPVAIQSPKK